MSVKRCERDFACLLSEEVDCCSVENYVGYATCFLAKENKRRCESGNTFSFGYSYLCNCPIRGELYRQYNI